MHPDAVHLMLTAALYANSERGIWVLVYLQYLMHACNVCQKEHGQPRNPSSSSLPYPFMANTAAHVARRGRASACVPEPLPLHQWLPKGAKGSKMRAIMAKGLGSFRQSSAALLNMSSIEQRLAGRWPAKYCQYQGNVHGEKTQVHGSATCIRRRQ